MFYYTQITSYQNMKFLYHSTKIITTHTQTLIHCIEFKHILSAKKKHKLFTYTHTTKALTNVNKAKYKLDGH